MSHPAPPGARVLLVDDDALLRGMAAKTLRHAGFELVECEDGEAALAAYAATPFDLVLLDVMMPGMDGYETCARLRDTPEGARVPILMLTGLNDSESIELAYQAGATDFIAKPINWTLLSHRVRYALRAGAAVESAMRSRERLERAQQIANMGSWEIRLPGGEFVCSPELARVFGAPDKAVQITTGDDLIACVCADDRETVREMRAAAARNGQGYQLTYRIERFDGALRTVYEQASAVHDASGRPRAIEGITQDVSDRVEAEQRIRRLAHYDGLTGLPNRQFFDDLAGKALERSRRLGSVCALLHVDVDRFKTVNDAFGHAEGDTVLKLMTERLQTSIRASDIAAIAPAGTSDAVVARVGANSFTLLLVDVGNDGQAAQVAERLQKAISAPIELRGREMVLTASIGIALYPRDAGDAKGLARCAEQAAYAAKGAGRAQHHFFDEAMNALASERLARETDLRHAIGDGQLRLYYQPKVDAGSGRILGAEALVRWMHPQRGLVPPGEFIPLAEESGLILPLTDWVIETACTDLRRRVDAGLRIVPISVNLAAPSFVHDGLLEQLDERLARLRIDPAWLTFEVTESLLMTDIDHAVERLTALRERGFGLSLDDFGTGYSSLSYLKRFPVHELKIDRSFVVDVCSGGRDGALAASIIALGREFGLRVIAEGVETGEQAAFLLGHGCPHQQGYLYARPMPVADFDALMVTGAVERAKPLAVPDDHLFTL